MKAYDIENRRELFVDHFLIDQLDNVSLKLHPPVSQGKVFSFDRPWEGSGCGYASIITFGGKYYLYYRGKPFTNDDDDKNQCTCLAISDDGVNWQRPELDLFEAITQKPNNVIFYGDGSIEHNFSPFIDENPDCDPKEIFKAIGGTLVSGIFLLVSPDGIHWQKKYDTPIMTKPLLETSYFFDSQNNVFFSRERGCYVCYFRVFDRGFRSVATATSKDLQHWNNFEFMEFGDSPREHLYTNQTHPYFRAKHIGLAIAARFMPDKQVLPDAEAIGYGIKDYKGDGYWHDCSDCVFMTTRGGNVYDRTFMEAFVRPGLDRRNWNSRSNYPVKGVVQTGEQEMSVYIERHNAQDSKFIERMGIRLDGFASLNAPYKGGSVRTISMRCPGGKLAINYSTSAAGEIKVQILDDQNKVIPKFAFENNQILIGDEIQRVVSWSEPANLDSLKGKDIKLEFQMKDADIFSIQFQR